MPLLVSFSSIRRDKKTTALQELAVERETLMKLYQRSVIALQETPTSQVSDKNHKKMESLFVRGLCRVL